MSVLEGSDAVEAAKAVAVRLVTLRRELVDRRQRFDGALARMSAAPVFAGECMAVRSYVNALEAVLAVEAGLAVGATDGLEDSE